MVVEGEGEVDNKKGCDTCGARFTTNLNRRKHQQGVGICAQIRREIEGEEVCFFKIILVKNFIS